MIAIIIIYIHNDCKHHECNHHTENWPNSAQSRGAIVTISETIDDHNHHIGDHDDDNENLPNSGESHEAPPEGVKERPGAGRIVLFVILNQLDIN